MNVLTLCWHRFGLFVVVAYIEISYFLQYVKVRFEKGLT